MSDANIPDSLGSPIQGPAHLTPFPTKGESHTGVDSGISSIEKSKTVAAPMIPLAGFPLLQVPSHDETFSLIVGAIALSGSDKSQNVEVFILSQQLRLSEMVNELLDAWNKNLKEMEEQTRRLLNSPLYQELMLIRVRGDPHQGNVSGIQPVISANAAASNPVTANAAPDSFLSAINRLHVLERVPPVATIPDPSDPTDMTKMLTIPLVGAFFAGSTLLVGSLDTAVSTTGWSQTLASTFEIVERLQPVIPQLTPDIVPLINLLVTPLIYYASWDNAINHLRNKEGDASRAAIQDFARHVIKMIQDPTFILLTIVNKMPGAEQMNAERKEQMVAVIKLILAAVGLSLLYSSEVGKVQKGKFLGMEPQEFQALLSGEMQIPDPNHPGHTTQEKLMVTLLNSMRAQLDLLPAHARADILLSLFDYLAGGQEVKKMLEPSKVFQEVLNSSHFNPGIVGIEMSPS